MFFVLGTPRSGTTLISQCLSAHPDIIVPNETDFIVPAALLYDRLSDPAVRSEALKTLIPSTKYFYSSLGEYLAPEEVHAAIDSHSETFNGLLTKLYSEVAAKAGAKLGGDKSPNDISFVAFLERAGGFRAPTKIIHIVRDVRSVLASQLEQNWIRNRGRGPVQFARTWTHDNLFLHEWTVDLEGRYIRVSLEDFTAEPEAQMRRLLAHLGCDFHPNTLNPEKRNRRYEGDPHHAKLYQPISTEHAQASRKALTPELREMCEREARIAMDVFGYRRTA